MGGCGHHDFGDFKGDFPLMDPTRRMGITDVYIVDLINRIKESDDIVLYNDIHHDCRSHILYQNYDRKEQVREIFSIKDSFQLK